MDKILTNYLGGFPLVLDDYRFFDNAYRDAMNSMLLGFGTDFIVQGCELSGANVAAGYIMLNSELLKVDAHIMLGGGYFQKNLTFDPNGLKLFNNPAVTHDTYQVERGIAIANTGTLTVVGGQRLINMLLLSSVTGSTKGHIPVIGTDLIPDNILITDSNNRLKSTGTTYFDGRYSNINHTHIESDPTLDTTLKDAAITIDSFIAHKYGRIVTVSMRIKSTTTFNTTSAIVGVLSTSPNLPIYFAGGGELGNIIETASGDILGSGRIRVRIGWPNEWWRFNFTFFADE